MKCISISLYIDWSFSTIYIDVMTTNDKEKKEKLTNTEIFWKKVNVIVTLFVYIYIKERQTVDGQWYESYSFLFRCNDKNWSICMKMRLLFMWK